MSAVSAVSIRGSRVPSAHKAHALGSWLLADSLAVLGTLRCQADGLVIRLIQTSFQATAVTLPRLNHAPTVNATGSDSDSESSDKIK